MDIYLTKLNLKLNILSLLQVHLLIGHWEAFLIFPSKMGGNSIFLTIHCKHIGDTLLTSLLVTKPDEDHPNSHFLIHEWFAEWTFCTRWLIENNTFNSILVKIFLFRRPWTCLLLTKLSGDEGWKWLVRSLRGY